MEQITLKQEALQQVLDFVERGWAVLTRYPGTVAASQDPLFPNPDRAAILYVPHSDISAARERLTLLPSGERKKIEIRQFSGSQALRRHGTLWLPNPYVVPGGAFNWQYYWDSYWIVRGLVISGKNDLARGMVENFIYEMEHYGIIPNANTTNFLTRSQPPFLTLMIMAIFKATGDKDWLRRVLPMAKKHYRFWTEEPRLVPQTGLSRYWNSRGLPSPEVLAHEIDEHGRSHYQRLVDYLASSNVDELPISRFYNRRRNSLTSTGYRGDGAMRESGFDTSNRWGLGGIGTITFNPVCLNSLLYAMESDLAEICRILEDEASSKEWQRQAEQRKELINEFLWDDEIGLFYDYDFTHKGQRHYPYVTTFYPLWLGLASAEQADKVVANLPRFEREWGVKTSVFETGHQWDGSRAWPPMQTIVVEGLRRYGYDKEANRISLAWLRAISLNFEHYGLVAEKYDAETGDSRLRHVDFGYPENVTEFGGGFGWTNGSFLILHHSLRELGLI